MLVPMQWLKDYIEIDADLTTFCERMIMSGSNLEGTETFGEGIEKVVVGRIERIEKHPDADKLLICRLDVGGEEPVQIVTGAANVFEGALVPVCLHGSKIPGPLHGQPKQEGGVTIKKGKLRGVESAGMLCSASELGFADKVVPVSHRDGIFILPEECQVGEDIVKALDFAYATVDFEITPNRPDCLSMVGMAREAAATFQKSFRYPETACQKESGEITGLIDVEIKRADLCRRYVARVVQDVKIGPSPWWLQNRLMASGMRPINNIVDITNFVMLEYGEPIHAFDIRQIAGGKIVVDTASAGESFTTLDDNERKLTGDMLMIRDAERNIAIAGVMGGLNSEIKEDTRTIVIEAANFDKDSVRATSKKLALRTEASARFEKGVDPNLCKTAADRVCRLIEELGVGTVVAGAMDVYPEPLEPWHCDVRVSRVNQVLGTVLSREEMEGIFRRLEMKTAGEGNVIRVTPHTVRQDLLTEIDYVEEAARIYGYDRLPTTLPKGSEAAGKSRKRTLADLARDVLCGLGANEIQTYSFVSPRGVSLVRAENEEEKNRFVRILNPLGEENSVMRTTLVPNMMEALGRNFTRNVAGVRAFELGNTFLSGGTSQEGLPEERDGMVIAAYGPGESFFTLKGMIEELMNHMGIRNLFFTAESGNQTYHPGRCARIFSVDREIGILGEVHPDVTDKYDIAARCYLCELRFDMVIGRANIEKTYRPLPKYPAVGRDIALTVDEDVAAETLRRIILREGDNILESVSLFDVYRGKQVADNKKSVAFALVYRAQDRTLTDEEVGKVHGKVLTALRDEADAFLREM